MLFRKKLHSIIFEADTLGGKCFDFLLMVAIIASVAVVMLDSIQIINLEYGDLFYTIEWTFTALFTVEYFLRLYAVDRPSSYARSFFGIVDLLAILPTYVSVFLPGSQALLVLRLLRVLRVFRILKLVRFIGESQILIDGFKRSARKIVVFLFAVVVLVVIFGSVMYVIESNQNSGFTSIPKSIYWAVVTLTTVGYGDISPITNLGQFIAAVIMILGYSIIAVPAGIVTANVSSAIMAKVSTQVCPDCCQEGHRSDATFCYKCGAVL